MRGITRRYVSGGEWRNYNLRESNEVSAIRLIIRQLEEALKYVNDSEEVTFRFSPISENTLDITVFGSYRFVFNAELTLEERVYTRTLIDNEHYDGYLDTAKDVERYTPTEKLKEIAESFLKILKKKWLNISIRYN